MIKPRPAALVGLLLAATMTVGLSTPALATPKPKPTKSESAMSEAEKDLAFNSFLDQLVAKGVVTAAQAEAIANAMKAKRADRAAKMKAFAAKADAVIAEVLGLAVDKFRELRAARMLPKVTPEQKVLIRTKLDALAVSLGLPKAPKSGK